MKPGDWYKDAIFYEVYVRGFFDSDADGNGDLRGLIEKLDYLQDLGVDCLWLMPIYPSPLKDDGYDITDFCSIHPSIGIVEDFEALTKAAHDRGIRIIADLVLSHTSDQHPWFQEARRDPDSPYRDYYVWSDTDRKYQDARIIFKDTEHSNWTWDSSPGQYYWHRFFSHQPDLNYDNPIGPPGDSGRRLVLARPRHRRLPRRCRALPLRARGHQLREPAGNACLLQGIARPCRRALSRHPAARRSQSMASRSAPVFRRTTMSFTWRSIFR